MRANDFIVENNSSDLEVKSTAKHMYDRYKDHTYTAAQRADDHAMSYESNTVQYRYWTQVADEIHRLAKLDKQGVTESTSGKTSSGYTWSFEHGGEIPWKSDAEANTFIRVKDGKGKTVLGVWADVYKDNVEVQYSEVFDKKLRGKGIYTDFLKGLSKHYNIISDQDQNNAAREIYKKLGAAYDYKTEKHTLSRPNQGVAEGSYQEGGSITHDGVEYDFDKVLAIAETKPTKQCAVSKLTWVLAYDKPDINRLKNADISVPIVITKSNNGKLTVIDGLHRLAKAVDTNINSLPVKYITNDELQSARLKQRVAEGSEQINEYRDRLLQYVKSLLPTWPEYVLKDWLVPNKGDFSNLPDTELKKGVARKLRYFNLSANTKWQLIPNMKFTVDMFNEVTKQILVSRTGGKIDSEVPNDAERHSKQYELAQREGGVRKEPVLLVKTDNGYILLEGWHRTIQHFAKYPNGYTGPAYVAVASGQQGVSEDTVEEAKKRKRKKNHSPRSITTGWWGTYFGDSGDSGDGGGVEESLNEFSPGGGSEDILKTLARNWVHGDAMSGDLDSDIQSQEQVERRLQRGIICSDGVKRSLNIDWNSDYDGVVIFDDNDNNPWSVEYNIDRDLSPGDSGGGGE